MNKVSKETIARTVVLLIALVNQVLTIFGINPIPYSDTQVYEAVSMVLTVVTSLIAWWKNNSFTQAAMEGDKVMKAIKEEDKNVENNDI